jgi:hypothetical protein
MPLELGGISDASSSCFGPLLELLCRLITADTSAPMTPLLFVFITTGKVKLVGKRELIKKNQVKVIE